MDAVEKLAIGEPPSNPDKMVTVKLGKNNSLNINYSY